MPNTVHAAVRAFFARLEQPVTSVLAAVSGGADSTAMLFALADVRGELALDVHAGTLHHGQRPEAEGEVTRLGVLCDTLGVPFHVGRANVPAEARAAKDSLEVAGRQARYRFLYETAANEGIDAVATAHTRDDQAETILLRVLAGTGLGGLCGIAPVREAVPPEAPRPTLLLRPILDARRADAEALCRERGWVPVRDPSNLDLSYPRNRLRHEVLPLIEMALNPGVRDALNRLADIAREDEAVLAALTDDLTNLPEPTEGLPVVAHVAPLVALPLGLRRRVARRLLERAGATGKGLAFDAVERLLATAPGGTVDMGAGIRCVSDGAHLVLAEFIPSVKPVPFEVPVAVPGETALQAGVLRAEVGVRLAAFGPWQTALDPSRLPGPLVARSRRPGDRIRLSGGTKKVGDLMTDRKVPGNVRDLLPVISCGETVVWVPGLGTASGLLPEAAGPVARLSFTPPLFETRAT